MSSIKWGVIGTATIAKNHIIPAMQRARNAELYAIASRDKAKLMQYENKCHKLYGSYDALLEDPNIQAVYIPLPNHLHCEWTVKAAEKGKHILCEKPLAMSYEECVRMRDAAKSNNVYLMEGFMSRHTAKTKLIRDIVLSGVLGPIRYINALHGFDINDQYNVRLRRDTGGGALFDMGCYCVNFCDMVMELVGAGLVSANAQLINRDDVHGEAVDIRCNANLVYDNGTLCNIATWFDGQPTALATIVGRSGTLTIPYPFTDDKDPMKLSCYDYAADPMCAGREIMVINPDYMRTQTIDIPDSDRYCFEIEELSRAIITGEEPSFGIDASLRNMKTIERLYATTEVWKEKELITTHQRLG